MRSRACARRDTRLGGLPVRVAARLQASAPGVTPNDLSDDGNDWKFAATAGGGQPVHERAQGAERGARRARGRSRARPSTPPGRRPSGAPTSRSPCSTPASSGTTRDAMLDLRRKMRLNRGELPTPNATLDAARAGRELLDLRHRQRRERRRRLQRASTTPATRASSANRAATASGPSDLLDPQDLMIAFANGTDDDCERVRRRHRRLGLPRQRQRPVRRRAVRPRHRRGAGLHRARPTTAATVGALPELHGRSRCASATPSSPTSNHFAQAAIYAVDNGVLVIQEALGTLNNSSHLARQAVEYAYDHGVTVIASAADEAAQHHNWPSNYCRT